MAKATAINLGKTILSSIVLVLTVLGAFFGGWQYFSSSTAELTADIYAYPYLSYETELIEEYLDELKESFHKERIKSIGDRNYDQKALDEKEKFKNNAIKKLDVLNTGEFINGIVRINIVNDGENIAENIEIVVEHAIFYSYSNDKSKEVEWVRDSVLSIPEIRQGDNFKVISWTRHDPSKFFGEGNPDIRINFPSGTAELIYHHDVSTFFRILDEHAFLIVLILFGTTLIAALGFGIYLDEKQKKDEKQD